MSGTAGYRSQPGSVVVGVAVILSALLRQLEQAFGKGMPESRDCRFNDTTIAQQGADACSLT